MTKTNKYVLWFAQEHVNFRFPEIDSITKLFKIPWKLCNGIQYEPLWIVELPNEVCAKQIASRAVSLKSVLELWSHGSTYEEFHRKLNEYLQTNNKLLEPLFSSNQSFKIIVETFNKHFTQSEKVDKIETLAYLPFKGKVDLHLPKTKLIYIEYYGLDPNNVPEFPNQYVLGKWIAEGQRNLIKELSLKTRKFIGNTSMDAQLSLIMANNAKVKKNDLVLDPFVGTGSLLVSAAKYGGYVLGTDIDFKTLHAKTRPTRVTQTFRHKDESVKSNLNQYGCKDCYLDVIISDFSSSIWQDQLKFDAIITDPPYGIREATEKVDNKCSQKLRMKKNDEPHFPSTSTYSLTHLYRDLLCFSAQHLNLYGRLVCWFPVYRKDYSDAIIPQHENFVLVANSEQLLSSFISRRLLTYEKISEPLTCFKKYLHNDTSNDFRIKYFSHFNNSREERKMQKVLLREKGRQEALKRGKHIKVKDEVI